jgi:CHAT domain-containing protein
VKSTIAISIIILFFIGNVNFIKAQPAVCDTAWANQFGRRINDALNENNVDFAAQLIAATADSVEKRYGPRSKEMSEVLEWDAKLSLFIDAPKPAIQKAETCLQIRKEQYGPRHLKVASAMTLLAQVREQTLGPTEAVENLFVAALNMLDSLGLKYSDESLDCMNSLGLFYKHTGRYDQCERYLLGAFDIEEKLHGRVRYEYDALANNIGSLYGVLERLPDAAKYFEISLEGTERKFGRLNPDYINSLKSIGGIYRRMGDLKRAEKTLMEALKLARQVYKPDDRSLAIVIWFVADFYAELGYYKEMAACAEEGYRIVAANNKLPSPIMVTAYVTKANSLGYLDKHAEAIALYQEVKDSLEASGQANGIQYANVLLRLCYEYLQLGRTDDAYQSANQSIELASKILGPNSIILYKYYMQCLPYFTQKPEQLERARKEATTGLQIMIDNFGAESLVASEWHNLVAMLNIQSNQPDIAIEHLENSFSFVDKRIRENFQFLSFSQQGTYLKTFNGLFKRMLLYGKQFPDRVGTGNFLYAVALLRKELLGLTSAKLFRTWQQTTDPVLRKQLSQYYNLRQQLVALELRPIAQQQGVQNLKDSLFVLEKQLLTISASLDFHAANQTPGWQQIRQTLKPDEAALEFILIPASQPLGTNAQYGALLLKQNMAEPELILLGDASETNRILTEAGDKPITYAEKIYGDGNSGRALYDLIWKPLSRKLADADKVFIAPTGLLLQLNFRALRVPETGKYLSDVKTLICLSTTRQLLDPSFSNPKIGLHGQAILLGGLDFDHANKNDSSVKAEDIEKIPSTEMSELQVKLSADDERGGYRQQWGALPETLVEVTQIDSLLRSKGIVSQLVIGKNGTEAFLKSHCSGNNAPTILHIATHGFFYAQARQISAEVVDKPGFLFSENPMLRSGLVFAGANPAWKGKPDPDAPEDGILTAEEVTFLNLQQTDLVVLSACETGLGEIQDYEGLFGLQRAFRLAGAKNLVMTLWRVPDQTTREFMVDFYARMSGGATVRTAFQNAVKFMRKKYPAPYYWAGFVLADGTR